MYRGVPRCNAWLTAMDVLTQSTKRIEFPTPFDGLQNFRDPKVFRYEPQQKWVMIVSADKNMRFYASNELKRLEIHE